MTVPVQQKRCPNCGIVHNQEYNWYCQWCESTFKRWGLSPYCVPVVSTQGIQLRSDAMTIVLETPETEEQEEQEEQVEESEESEDDGEEGAE